MTAGKSNVRRDRALLGRPPDVLAEPAAPNPLPPPIHEADEVTTLHTNWARLAAGGGEEPPQAQVAGGGRVRAKVRARVAAATAANAATAQSQDRGLVGDLIRAVDAIAQRVDDLGARLNRLERLVQVVFDTLSEDLVRVLVAVDRSNEGVDNGPEEGDTETGRPGGGGGTEA